MDSCPVPDFLEFPHYDIALENSSSLLKGHRTQQNLNRLAELVKEDSDKFKF